MGCQNPSWGDRCSTTLGSCVGGGENEGCNETGVPNCETCYRGEMEIQGLVPGELRTAVGPIAWCLRQVGTAYAAAGLEVGDEIWAINGRQITPKIMRRLHEAKKFTASVFRPSSGEDFNVEVQIEDRLGDQGL